MGLCPYFLCPYFLSLYQARPEANALMASDYETLGLVGV